MAKVLIVLTSHTDVGDTGKKTGFYFDEMATPYWGLVDAGHDVVIASIKGGKPEYDPSSVKPVASERPAPVQRFFDDTDAMAKLEATIAISDVDPGDYDAIFLPGGHGTVFDFPNNAALANTVGKIFDAGGVIGAVCHGPAGLVSAKRADGKPVVAGLRVNSFTDAEEEAVGLTHVVPLLLETSLKNLGAQWEGTDNFKSYAVRDGQLVTGQNPASAAAVTEELIAAIGAKERAAA